ncbi:OmpA family protein [Caballeronia sp. BR00000012568055]|uniref:OmpA family protein n=1 Tax=Caballeronia sp. BR00000012568055 TaxID=2918761 RepID=UPI0023F70FF2|nr:OmpA family protein [Caballeronia sp. BR00000012568055]
MSMNLNQLVQGALTESVLQQLAGRIGCAPEAAKRVVSLCAPALIGSMMNKASSLDGAHSLFAAIMSPSTNAHIADELPHFVVQDDGFKTLIESGEHADGAVASHDSLTMLSERIAEHTGVAASATRTMAGVVGATVLGVLKRYFTQHGGNVGQLPTLLGHQLPVVRANMTDAFAHALGLGSVGAFLAGVASRLKAVSTHLEHPATHQAAAFPLQTDAPAVAEHEVTKDKGNKKAWMWIASAAALALFAALAARGCSHENADQDTTTDAGAKTASSDAASAAAAPVMAASSADPASVPALLPRKASLLNVDVDSSGVPTIKATVNTEAERQSLIDALSAKLGADKFHANITVDPDTRPATWLDKLDGLLPIMSQPDAHVQIIGDKIEVSGSAADAKFGWLDKLKALFGKGWNIGMADADAQTPASAPVAASAQAQDASANGECSTESLVRMLNLKPVTFRIGSNTPPQAAMSALAKAAQTIKKCDSKATPIKLQIGGYSDNTGSAALNLALSKKRAQAVRSFLVKNGVPASALTVAAFGSANPIADNATAAGRMQNRRVEFKDIF